MAIRWLDGRAFRLAALAASLAPGAGLRAQADGPQDGAPAAPASSPQDAGAEEGASEAAGGAAMQTFSAVVAADGTLVRGRGAASARKLNAPGRYEVLFDAEVRQDAYAATIGHAGDQIEPMGLISVAGRAGKPKAVFVQTSDPGGNLADRGFHLIVAPADGPRIAVTPTSKLVQVVVQRHPSVALTEAEADRILSEMGQVLQSADGAGDVAVPVRFERLGPIRVLASDVPGTVMTQADLNRVFALPGVKVLRGIQYCGGPGGSIIGCAPVGSPAVNEAVVRFTPAQEQEGILWVHEYGHNAGLSHRQDDPDSIMFPSIGGTHRKVSQAEAIAFGGGPAAASGRVMAAGHGQAPAAPAEQAGPSRRPDDVREFVRRHYAEGVPYEVASTYTEGDAEILLKMLADPKANEEFLPEIVTTLCFIGSEKAADPLMDFVKKPPAGETAFRAQKAALIHLGDLANETKNQAVVDLLDKVAAAPAQAKAMAAPIAAEAAARREGDVVPPSADELAAELAVSATWGLALSGTQKAEAAINSLGAADSAAFAPVRQLAAEAAKMAQQVRAKGHKEYRMSRQRHDESE